MLNRRQASAGGEEFSATHIGQDVVIEGTVRGQGVLRIEGKIIGDVEHSGTVVIGEKALAQATLRVKELVIHGTVEGKIHADRCEVMATARIQGELKAARITVAEGAVILGECAVSQAQGQK